MPLTFLIPVATCLLEGRISVANLSLALRMLCVTIGTSIHICLINAGHGGVCLQPRCWGLIEAEDHECQASLEAKLGGP